MTKNEKRAGRALDALSEYKIRFLGESGPMDEDTLIDLVTDIFHAVHQGKIPPTLDGTVDLHRIVRIAENHFESEGVEE